MKTVAMIGATGAVDRLLRLLEERAFPLASLRCFASPKSKGKTVLFRGCEIPLETLDDFKQADLSFFCAGSSISKEWIGKIDTIAIDSSSAFRKDPHVPLVIPEINAHALAQHQGLIASPNCAATILLMPLFALHRKFRIKRIVASTYQAASGAGAFLLRELQEETRAALAGQSYAHALPLSLRIQSLSPQFAPRHLGLCRRRVENGL